MNLKNQVGLVMLVGLLAFTSLPASAMTDQQMKLLDQLDQMDQLEFVAQIEKASVCITARDFGCAEKKLVKAAKYANNPQDKKTLKVTRQDLVSERRMVAEEERQRLEEERRQAEEERQRVAEERRLAEEERQQVAKQEEDDRRALQWERQQAANDERRAQEAETHETIMAGIAAVGGAIESHYQAKIDASYERLAAASAAKEQRERDAESAKALRTQAAEQAKAQREREKEIRDANQRAQKADRDRQQVQAKAERERKQDQTRAERNRQQEQTKTDRNRKQEQVNDQTARKNREAVEHLAQKAEQRRQQEQERLEKQAQTARDREAKKEAQRTARVKTAAPQPELPKYRPQVVVIPTANVVCPPGSTWYNAAGVGVKGGTCYKNAPSLGQTQVASNSDTQRSASGTKTNPKTPGSSGDDTQSNTSASSKKTDSRSAGASNADGTTDNSPKKSEKKLFRKVPHDPPRGSAPEGLTTAKGNYKCAAINAYAHQFAKAEDQLFNERMDAPFRSDAKCQTRCDLLAWREEVLATYRYHGSWDCSVSAVGLWNGVDAGGSYSSYHDGKNDDSCTCVTSGDIPILFSATPK